MFLQIRKVERLNRILPQLLQILESNVPEDPAATIVNSWTGGFVPEMRVAFRRQLITHLFGWDSLVALRLRLAIADFCWVCYFETSLVLSNITRNVLEKSKGC